FVKNSEDEILISVNMSANSICREDFVDSIRSILEETEFPPNRLEVEITEYSFAESGETTTANIEALRKMGVKIALDDFGTGYTSLAQLVKLPVNLLKIDKSLVDDIETNTTNRDFVNAIIYMGHLMGCDVLSEGVETQMQIDLLREQNCDYVQGFIWDRPLYYEAAIAMIKS
ncbi:MAG: EAL domain-containing protein, partial [Lachnospiraceae bacterium]|nr:EAL domain-containing protein [Lachnospiraceae bacterium]